MATWTRPSPASRPSSGTRFGEARRRGFDFSKDYRVLDALGETLYERARQARGEARKAEREGLLHAAAERFEQTLALDPEDLAAHHNLAQVYQALGETERAEQHRRLHAAYKPDDNAADFALAEHRRGHPAADHAAEAVVIYDLRREVATGRIAQGVGCRKGTTYKDVEVPAVAATGPGGTLPVPRREWTGRHD